MEWKTKEECHSSVRFDVGNSSNMEMWWFLGFVKPFLGHFNAMDVTPFKATQCTNLPQKRTSEVLLSIGTEMFW